MSTEIIDLDELLGDDKRVRLKGNWYTLPPDLPVELYLRINRAAKQDMTEMEIVETLYGHILELFRYGDPKLETLPLGISQIIQVIPTVYGNRQADGEERPTTPKTRGASGVKAPRRPARSRS